MNLEFRLIIITLDAFAAASLGASLAVLWLGRRPLPAGVSTRATLLFLTRLLPTLAGTLCGLVALVSNLVYEQRGGSPERLGGALVLLAAAAALFILVAIARAWLLWMATRRVLRRWMKDATPVHLPGAPVPTFSLPASFPVVAVVGVLSPRLFIAESILATCTADELAAILAHERTHVRRRDNFCRGLMAAMPDILSLLPIGRRLTRAWHHAIERRADSAVRELGAYGPVSLAQALVRVARLATAPVQPPLPASALYGGGSIESRIRHLLEPVTLPGPRPWRAMGLVAGTILCAVTLGATHGVLELVARHLP